MSEQNQKFPCGGGYLHLKKVTKSHTYHRFVPFRCKSWDCPECRLLKVKTIQSAIYRLFKNKKLTFLTITDLHKTSAQEAWATFGKRWNRLRGMLVREYGKMSYLRILEPHKGEPFPHSHILVDKAVTNEKLKEFCLRAGFGWSCDAKPMTTKSASTYVTKYMTKDWPKNGANELRKLTNCRIVQASRDLGAIFKKVSDWEMVGVEAKRSKVVEDAKNLAYKLQRKTGMRAGIEYGDYGVQMAYETKYYRSDAETFADPYYMAFHDRKRHERLLTEIASVVDTRFALSVVTGGNPQDPTEEAFEDLPLNTSFLDEIESKY